MKFVISILISTLGSIITLNSLALSPVNISEPVAIVGGTNCPMEKPVAIVTPTKITFSYSQLKVPKNTTMLTCSYRVPLQSNQNFKITKAKFIASGSKLSSNSQITMNINVGTESKTTLLKTLKNTSLNFPTACNQPGIIGSSVTLIDKTGKTNLKNTNIELTLAPCK